MPLNFFKDLLFDVLNDSDLLNAVDINVNDKENTFTLKMDDGSTIYLKCSKELF